MWLITEIETLLPLAAAILKIVVTNPAKYASLKGAFQTALNVATQIVADLNTILAGM